MSELKTVSFTHNGNHHYAIVMVMRTQWTRGYVSYKNTIKEVQSIDDNKCLDLYLANPAEYYDMCKLAKQKC